MLAAAGRRLPAAAAVAGVAALNAGFLAMLARRGGLRLAVGGLGLQVLHEVSAAAALPAAMVQHAASRGRGPLS